LHLRIGRALVDDGPLATVQLLKDLDTRLLLPEKRALGLFARCPDQMLETASNSGCRFQRSIDLRATPCLAMSRWLAPSANRPTARSFSAVHSNFLCPIFRPFFFHSGHAAPASRHNLKTEILSETRSSVPASFVGTAGFSGVFALAEFLAVVHLTSPII
jgi:hypothetical protein